MRHLEQIIDRTCSCTHVSLPCPKNRFFAALSASSAVSGIAGPSVTSVLKRRVSASLRAAQLVPVLRAVGPLRLVRTILAYCRWSGRSGPKFAH